MCDFVTMCTCDKLLSDVEPDYREEDDIYSIGTCMTHTVTLFNLQSTTDQFDFQI